MRIYTLFYTLFAVLLAFGSLLNIASAQNVEFPDANLANKVRGALNLPSDLDSLVISWHERYGCVGCVSPKVHDDREKQQVLSLRGVSLGRRGFPCIDRHGLCTYSVVFA